MRILAAIHGLDEAARDPGRRVAWCTSVGPAELLRSMGFLVYFPENHGATLGAMRLGPDLIDTTTATSGWTPNSASRLVTKFVRKSTIGSRPSLLFP